LNNSQTDNAPLKNNKSKGAVVTNRYEDESPYMQSVEATQ
jgi:hypothetical protein